MANTAQETPMMAQFRKIKEQYPDALLLFRCGDFYETYLQDAVKASKILNITLTKRNNGSANLIEMAGFPYHALDTYLPKLVRAGLRVAICDQLEDPRLTKKLVKRGVTELVTPGVSYSDTTLVGKENNFVACVALPHKAKEPYGIALLDISTGEFLATQGQADYIDKLLVNFAPKEVLYERGKRDAFETAFGTKYFTFELDDWMLTLPSAEERLNKQFETQTLKGFGISEMPYAIISAGAILHYLDITQHLQTSHIRAISRIEEERFVWMDRFTIRNLELFGSQHDDAISFCDILDETLTPMGGRLLRRWISFPLKRVEQIRRRQQVVEYCFRDPALHEELRQRVQPINDLERLIGKVATGRITPRDTLQIHNALSNIAVIKRLCGEAENEELRKIGNQLETCDSISQRIKRTLVTDPPAQTVKPGYIAEGVNAELDELRHLQRDGRKYLLNLQEREAEKTGIQSLKIGFNNVFGYYLEVRNTYKDLVPADWIRKQTLAQAERYITQELKKYEEKILGAEERIIVLEQQIYNELIAAIAEYVPNILTDAHLIASLDCLLALAKVARDNKYICPDVNDSLIIDIKQGRHPVIEKNLPLGEQYIANDVLLDNNSQQIIILTGPNMAGKSALLRQTALIVLMAQIGSFVPAQSASIGIVDKIFTRVGASDNISLGESTFMVEMNEAAAILNNLSERSLVLFDELGRGTSTYDGISIAWAIVQYIHETPYHAKTLFATHYHELNEMEETYKRIRNYNVSVKEIDGKVIFLRKLVRGGSEHSFGIHVAKLAGMPPSIVQNAEQILKRLEKNSQETNKTATLKNIGENHEGLQLSFFQLDDPVLEQIREQILQIDINSLTPIEALNQLNRIKGIITG